MLDLVMTTSKICRRSIRGSAGNPICSRTWHKSFGNSRGMDSVRGKLLQWTLSSKWNKEVMINSVGLNQIPQKSGTEPLEWLLSSARGAETGIGCTIRCDR